MLLYEAFLLPTDIAVYLSKVWEKYLIVLAISVPEGCGVTLFTIRE